MDTLRSQVAGLLTQYGTGSRSEQNKEAAGELLALVLKGSIQETDLQTAVGLGPTDMLVAFLMRVAQQQQGQSTSTHICPHAVSMNSNTFTCYHAPDAARCAPCMALPCLHVRAHPHQHESPCVALPQVCVCMLHPTIHM